MKEYSQLQPYQQRVVDEHKELTVKLDALERYLTSLATKEPKLRGISSEDYMLLVLQMSAMTTYQGLLELRISKF